MLLKACKGDWVVEKIEEAVEKWRQVNEQHPNEIVGESFSYKAAVAILKAQDHVNTQLLYNLPRF